MKYIFGNWKMNQTPREARAFLREFGSIWDQELASHLKGKDVRIGLAPMASAMGLDVTGSLGLLGKATQLGLLPALRPLVERALEAGIRYHPAVVSAVLKELGEG